MNPPDRFKSHRDTKAWWRLVSGITVENYDSREDLVKAERRAIKVESPLYNIVHNKHSQRATTSALPTTCGWFKPVWYGEAREAGRTRRLPMAVGERPNPDADVDANGRVLVTWAPRPPDWIDTVDRFLSKGLSKSQIAAFVRSTMRSDLYADDLWGAFSGKCWREIRTVGAEV